MKRDKNLTPSEFKEKYKGIKKSPDENRQLIYNNRLSEAKKKRRIESKKVKPTETIQQWARRVKKYNLVSENYIEKKLNQKKYIIQSYTITKNKEEQKNKKKKNTIILWYDEKHYDFLSYLGIVKNYFCIKNAIKKDDFEIALTFYNNKLITTDRFNNICILTKNTSSGDFQRFKKLGYINEVIKIEKNKNNEIKTISTGIFKLSPKMTNFITAFYKIMSKLNTLKNRRYKGLYPKEVEVEFEKMNIEIEDYLTGNINQQEL